MGQLYLVRHGQASFGADDYDQLSDLGRRQSVRLGEYFKARGQRFDAVITGSLKRHAQTWAGIDEGLGGSALSPLVWPGLNEYDSAAVIAAIPPAKDVDGLHPVNQGSLLAGRPGLRPCTPLAVVRLIEEIGLAAPGREHFMLAEDHDETDDQQIADE